jgi:hypothetical protein
LIYHLSSLNIVDIFVRRRDGVCGEELLNRLGVDELRVVQNGPEE